MSCEISCKKCYWNFLPICEDKKFLPCRPKYLPKEPKEYCECYLIMRDENNPTLCEKCHKPFQTDTNSCRHKWTSGSTTGREYCIKCGIVKQDKPQAKKEYCECGWDMSPGKCIEAYSLNPLTCFKCRKLIKPQAKLPEKFIMDSSWTMDCEVRKKLNALIDYLREKQ